MNAVLHRGGEQVDAALGKGRDQQRDALDVEDGIGFGVALRQQRAGLLGGEARGGNGKQHLPGWIAGEGCGFDAAVVFRGDGEASIPASGDVVGVAFAAAGFGDDVGVGQLQPAEVVSERDSRKQRGGAGAAAHSERNLVVQRQMQRLHSNACAREDVAIGVEDQVVLQRGAERGVTSGCANLEGCGRVRLDGDVHGQRKASCVKAGTKVGRRCGERYSQAVRCVCGAHAGSGALVCAVSVSLSESKTRSTLSASGSSTTGWRRICACCASSASVAPASSLSLRSSPRWKSMV